MEPKTNAEIVSELHKTVAQAKKSNTAGIIFLVVFLIFCAWATFLGNIVHESGLSVWDWYENESRYHMGGVFIGFLILALMCFPFVTMLLTWVDKKHAKHCTLLLFLLKYIRFDELPGSISEYLEDAANTPDGIHLGKLRNLMLEADWQTRLCCELN